MLSGASGTGDPHYTTFNNNGYTFGEGHGRHYFLMRVRNSNNESDVFFLQAYLVQPPGWRATTTKSIAFGVPGMYGYQVGGVINLDLTLIKEDDWIMQSQP